MKHHKNGFTLAEILITLGIIGIVAVLTIPVLKSYMDKRDIEAGLKKTYAEFQNLLIRSQMDNDSYSTWDYTNSDYFINQYIRPYMHLNSCNRNCFSGEDKSANGIWRRPNGELETEGWTRVTPKYFLDDGRSVAIAVAYDSSRNWRYMHYIVDVNGKRGKSVMGKDVFMFYLCSYNSAGHSCSGFHMGDGNNSGTYNAFRRGGGWIDNLKNVCKHTGRTCGVFLEVNGWNFPDDYPIKF